MSSPSTFVETVAASLESKLRGLLKPDLLAAMCIELAEEITADLAEWCPEKHEAWAHSTVKACPNCGVGVELNVHLPELACCFSTATDKDAEVMAAGFHGYEGCPLLASEGSCPTPFVCSERGDCPPSVRTPEATK